MKTKPILYVLAIVGTIIATSVMFCSCGSSRGGCYATKGMSGYHR